MLIAGNVAPRLELMADCRLGGNCGFCEFVRN
jgi:hypothetical protein